MSELTQCNHCSLIALKRRAKQDKQRVVLLPAVKKDKYFLGGLDVFRFPKSLMTVKQFNGLTNEEKQHWWVCWFWELTDHCVC